MSIRYWWHWLWCGVPEEWPSSYAAGHYWCDKCKRIIK